MEGCISLADYEDRLITRMGAWFPGERVIFRGKDLHKEFADADWMELYVYGITGRGLSAIQLKMLHSLWVYTSYPDPRLWNNRIAALAGTARSTGTLALSAALAVSEATIYGRRPDIRTINFLLQIKRHIDQGKSLGSLVTRELKTNRVIPGYGRPIIGTDERIPHIMKRAKHLGLDRGSFVRLAFDIEGILLKGRWRMRMNYAALSAAICADMGFTPRQYYLCAFPVFLSGMIPCFIESNENPEGAFLPLRCTRIAYEGPARRRWE